MLVKLFGALSEPFTLGPANDVLNRILKPIQARLGTDLREPFAIAAMAANGVDTRLPAARGHAERLISSLESYSGSPPLSERRRQDQEMFELASSLVSAINCLCIFACAVATIFHGTPHATQCEKAYPDEISSQLVRLFPDARLTRIVESLVHDALWSELKDLRAVLDHRGVLPRGFIGSGDPNHAGIRSQVAFVGSDPRNQARTFKRRFRFKPLLPQR